MQKEEIMITTHDNPYDPFTQFDDWYNFDRLKGYYSWEFVDRIAKTSEKMTEEEKMNATNDAIIEIVSYQPETYKVVRKKVNVDEIELKEDFLV